MMIDCRKRSFEESPIAHQVRLQIGFGLVGNAQVTAMTCVLGCVTAISLAANRSLGIGQREVGSPGSQCILALIITKAQKSHER